MDRTNRLGITAFDRSSQEFTYRCGCGSQIQIQVGDLIPDQFIDYHGCGNGDISFTPDLIAEYRKNCGLPQLGE